LTPRAQFEVSDCRSPAGPDWLATAVTVANVSLTATPRNQFNHLQTRARVDALLTMTRRRYGTPGGEA
jgi:hypothetical protein